MIDWRALAGSALWIIALAAALAVFSYTSWQAAQRAEKFSQRLRHPTVQAILSLCGVIFCAGLALLAHSALALFVWIVLGMLFLAQTVFVVRQSILGG